MTESELTAYRLQMQIQVRDMALRVLVAQVGLTPEGRQFLAGWANRVTAQAQAQTVPGVNAAISDLAAAEYQEALKGMFDGLGV